MKVLRITNSLDYGGIEKVFELHAKYHRKDYDIVFVALTEGGQAERVIQQMGCRVTVLGVPSRIPSLQCIRTLLAIFRAEKPDVIHTCGAEANFHGLAAGVLAGIRRRVGEEIGISNHSRLAELVFKIVFLFAHRVVAISHAVADHLKTFEAAERKISVVYNPVEIARPILPQSSVPGIFRISFVGRLEQIKNVSLLIKLIGSLRSRHRSKQFELWIIGDGTELNKLKNESQFEGHEHCVRFFGFVPQPADLLRQTSVFVLPSWFEGFGLACVEAIQCGVPVVVSDSGGMKEYIHDGINGFLFSPSSLEQLTSKIDTLMGMAPEEIAGLTTRARATVDSMFSPQRYLDELFSVYSPVVK